MDHFELDGKTAVVLHAETPAGGAIAKTFRDAGASVADNVDTPQTIDILACAPDVFLAKPMESTTDEDVAEIFASNFVNQFDAVRAAKPKMADGGRIVLLTSVLGERGLPNCTAYAAAQGAVHNFIRAAAQELAPAGVTINGIALGWMDWMDDRLDPTDEDASRAVRFTITKRAGDASDVGGLALWLAGTGSGFVTGQIYAVDGGLLQHL